MAETINYKPQALVEAMSMLTTNLHNWWTEMGEDPSQLSWIQDVITRSVSLEEDWAKSHGFSRTELPESYIERLAAEGIQLYPVSEVFLEKFRVQESD